MACKGPERPLHDSQAMHRFELQTLKSAADRPPQKHHDIVLLSVSFVFLSASLVDCCNWNTELQC